MKFQTENYITLYSVSCTCEDIDNMQLQYATKCGTNWLDKIFASYHLKSWGLYMMADAVWRDNPSDRGLQNVIPHILITNTLTFEDVNLQTATETDAQSNFYCRLKCHLTTINTVTSDQDWVPGWWHLHAATGSFILKTEGQRGVIGSSHSGGGGWGWGQRWREVSMVVDAATTRNYLPTPVLCREWRTWPSVVCCQPGRRTNRELSRESNLSFNYQTWSSSSLQLLLCRVMIKQLSAFYNTQQIQPYIYTYTYIYTSVEDCEQIMQIMSINHLHTCT